MTILTSNAFSDEASPCPSGPVVALATEDDREFLRSIFASSLDPFYDGDHEAHADRVLDAHLAAGTDSYGHFSVAQRTFVLWSDGSPRAQRLGVLHLAVKRQGTVKISPLILIPSHRRRDGLGTVLLRTALDFAWEQGARQLYCTVAAENTPAITFFVSPRSGCLSSAAAHSPRARTPLITWFVVRVPACRACSERPSGCRSAGAPCNTSPQAEPNRRHRHGRPRRYEGDSRNYRRDPTYCRCSPGEKSPPPGAPGPSPPGPSPPGPSPPGPSPPGPSPPGPSPPGPSPP
ncbi:GNAT family N-acetyltransferase, partial [Streptomyces sp. NPDC006309]|uniref:GNAT family N-acetyltransferase n=1 Tax=Streptomyces sp. NPDC006309 TaxID=3156749 RepID=UPI0033B6168B